MNEPSRGSTPASAAWPALEASGCAGIVVIGAGLAGLFTALKLAPIPVTVLSPVPLGEGASSAWAQGGLAAAVGADDSVEAHVADTIAAGAGLVDETVARAIAGAASARVDDLVSYGVPFDRADDGGFKLSREAAHSARRIVRVKGDRAGQAIMEALIARVRETPSITVLEGYEAFQFMRPFAGDAMVLLARHSEDATRIVTFEAAAMVLATGGIGRLYAVTTNPVNSRGQGVAMAAMRGAAIADAEFVQFHPTAIDVDADPAPLASEALRGEGATLVNADGRRFMDAYHPAGELGPRDIVARAVFAEREAGRGALLDCREAIGARFPTQFPTIHQHCRKAGIDPVEAPIPVVPAEHFHMGGIATDLNARSSVPRLWAVGEVAATGLHGANRLASNSLLEAVVMAARAAADIRATLGPTPGVPRYALDDMPQLDEVVASDKANRVHETVHQVRQTLAAHAGVLRDGAGLRDALRTLHRLEQQRLRHPRTASMVTCARFIVAAALAREESRGSHHRTDAPEPSPAFARRTAFTLADIDAITRAAL
ncbi:MAG: L-aspartate oxidase [Pseudomonadota bacterium]